MKNLIGSIIYSAYLIASFGCTEKSNQPFVIKHICDFSSCNAQTLKDSQEKYIPAIAQAPGSEYTLFMANNRHAIELAQIKRHSPIVKLGQKRHKEVNKFIKQSLRKLKVTNHPPDNNKSPQSSILKNLSYVASLNMTDKPTFIDYSTNLYEVSKVMDFTKCQRLQSIQKNLDVLEKKIKSNGTLKNQSFSLSNLHIFFSFTDLSPELNDCSKGFGRADIHQLKNFWTTVLIDSGASTVKFYPQTVSLEDITKIQQGGN